MVTEGKWEAWINQRDESTEHGDSIEYDEGYPVDKIASSIILSATTLARLL